VNAVHVSFQRYAADVVLPDYATAGAAGMDIAAYIDAPVTLAPFERAAIATGFAMQLPMAMKHKSGHAPGLHSNMG
jgi:dUTP pyrophosphatase